MTHLIEVCRRADEGMEVILKLGRRIPNISLTELNEQIKYAIPFKGSDEIYLGMQNLTLQGKVDEKGYCVDRHNMALTTAVPLKQRDLVARVHVKDTNIKEEDLFPFDVIGIGMWRGGNWSNLNLKNQTKRKEMIRRISNRLGWIVQYANTKI